MPSNPELSFQVRAFLLVLLLFTAGLALPTNQIRGIVNSQYPGVTPLFFSLVNDLLQRLDVLQIVLSYPVASVNILNYFQDSHNYDVAYWWLQNRAGIFRLISNGETYNILGQHPWLFALLRTVNETNPDLLDHMLQDRHRLNLLLRHISNHPEVATLVSPHSELISRLYDLANTLPAEGPWTRIIFPLNGTVIINSTQLQILTIADINITHVNFTLISNSVAVAAYNATGTPFYNSTLDATSLPNGHYLIVVNVTLQDGTRLSDTVNVIRMAPGTLSKPSV